MCVCVPFCVCECVILQVLHVLVLAGPTVPSLRCVHVYIHMCVSCMCVNGFKSLAGTLAPSLRCV
jgi:hypothetical protein